MIPTLDSLDREMRYLRKRDEAVKNWLDEVYKNYNSITDYITEINAKLSIVDVIRRTVIDMNKELGSIQKSIISAMNNISALDDKQDLTAAKLRVLEKKVATLEAFMVIKRRESSGYQSELDVDKDHPEYTVTWNMKFSTVVNAVDRIDALNIVYDTIKQDKTYVSGSMEAERVDGKKFEY